MDAAPVIRSAPRFLLAGVSFYGNPFLPAQEPELDQIELLWRRYGATIAVLPGFGSLPGVGYELHVYGEETASTGLLEVFAGQAVAESTSIPHELCLKTVGAALHAVLELRGDDATSDWHGLITREWLPGTGYEAVGTHDLLIHRLQPSGGRVPYEAWVPVRKRT